MEAPQESAAHIESPQEPASHVEAETAPPTEEAHAEEHVRKAGKY